MGKDIELLLLKKDVQKKLSSLNDIDIKTLPNTINKQVTISVTAETISIDRPQ